MAADSRVGLKLFGETPYSSTYDFFPIEIPGGASRGRVGPAVRPRVRGELQMDAQGAGDTRPEIYL